MITYPFPLDDYTVGYFELPRGHKLTLKEVKRLQAMIETLTLEEIT